MVLADLPDDLWLKICMKIGNDRWSKLGPLLRTGRRGRDVVYSTELLKGLYIYTLCSDPNDIYPNARYRPFFERCLQAGNPMAIYYEALRLLTKCEDIKGAISMLNQNVPSYANATLTAGILCVCDGDTEKAATYLGIFFQNHAAPYSEEVRMMAEELMRKISYYGPAYNDTYRSTFRFPEIPGVQFPECAMDCAICYGSDYIPLCSKCNLYWCARRICTML